MKLLFIGNLNGGGRERRMAQLVNGLSEYIDYEVKIVVSNHTIDYLDKATTSAEIVYVEDGSSKVILDGLKNVIDSFKPDIVHMWSEYPKWLFIISYLKYIYKFKYIAGFVASGSYLPWFSKLNYGYQMAYLTSDAIVSNSYAGIIARHAYKRKSKVIKNGFDFKRIKGSIDRIQIRKKHSLEDKIVITMVGRFEPLKDWGLFLELAKKFQNDNYNALFLSVGSGPMREEYEKKSKELGLNNVFFLGRRDDVESILIASDIFVLFNPQNKRAEGISNAIMEAMAVGLPVVATNAGGTPEIIEDKVTGFLVNVGNVDEASQLVEMLYLDEGLRCRMGKAAKERIQKEFSLKRMTDEYMALYQNILLK